MQHDIYIMLHAKGTQQDVAGIARCHVDVAARSM